MLSPCQNPPALFPWLSSFNATPLLMSLTFHNETLACSEEEERAETCTIDPPRLHFPGPMLLKQFEEFTPFLFLLSSCTLFKLQVKKDAEQQGHRKHSGDCRRLPYSAAVSLTHTDSSKLSFKLFNSSYTLPILLLGWHFMMKKRGKNKNIYKLDEGTIAEQTMSNK